MVVLGTVSVFKPKPTVVGPAMLTPSSWATCHRSLFIKNIKKNPEPRIRTQVSRFLVWSLNHYARIGITLDLVVIFLLYRRNALLLHNK